MPLLDIVSTHGKKKIVIKPSKSGTFAEAQKICRMSGLTLFEPRDEATYKNIIKFAQVDPIWLNIKRSSLEKP